MFNMQEQTTVRNNTFSNNPILYNNRSIMNTIASNDGK